MIQISTNVPGLTLQPTLGHDVAEHILHTLHSSLPLPLDLTLQLLHLVPVPNCRHQFLCKKKFKLKKIV